MLIHYKHLTDTSKSPTKAHNTDAGFDLYANEKVVLNPLATIGTGLAIRIPTGYVGLVCSRSGLASRGIFVMNAPGIIDAGYTGEIKIILGTIGSMTVIEQGDKIAQLLIQPVHEVHLLRGDSMVWGLTERGDNGFGSSGY